MHYELYVDSLFFLNFIMNLYLLILVNRSTFRTATPGRIAAGAALGAAGFLLPFLGGSLGMGVAAAGTIAGAAGMLFAAFPVRSLRMFLKLLEKLLLYSFGLGGMLLFLVRSLPGARKVLTSVPGLLAALQRQTAGRSLRRPVQGHPCEGGGADESERPGGLGKQSGGTHQRETCLRGGEKGI